MEKGEPAGKRTGIRGLLSVFTGLCLCMVLCVCLTGCMVFKLNVTVPDEGTGKGTEGGTDVGTDAGTDTGTDLGKTDPKDTFPEKKYLEITNEKFTLQLPEEWYNACQAVVTEVGGSGADYMCEVWLKGKTDSPLLYARVVSEEIPLVGGDPSRNMLYYTTLGDGTRLEIWWANASVILADEKAGGSWGEYGIMDNFSEAQIALILTLQWGKTMDGDALMKQDEVDRHNVPYNHMKELVEEGLKIAS